MIGFVLWCDPKSLRAIIWCEDHGELVVYELAAQTEGIMPLSGDLVAFDLVLQGNARFAQNLSVLEECAGDALIERLQAKEDPAKSMKELKTSVPSMVSGQPHSQKVIPFPGPTKRKPADTNTRRSG